MRWLLVVIGGFIVVITTGFFVVPSLLAWMDSPAEQTNNQYKPTDAPPTQEPLPSNARMAELAKEDPIQFLIWCEHKYDRTIVEGYSMKMQKQERIEGKLGQVEEARVHFREKPHSVFVTFDKGGGVVKSVLYVEGENQILSNGESKSALVIRSVIPGLKLQERDPEGKDALKSARFPLTQFGLKKGLQRTRKTWEVAREKNDLKVNYLGIEKLPQAGNRDCYKFTRPYYATPDDDGVADLTIWIDAETWYQVGILAKTREGEIVGEYYFHDIEKIDQFGPDQFTRKALTP